MLEMIQNNWLFAAGIAALLVNLLHVFAGGPEIAGPLLRSKDIHDVSKYVNYYCWHLVTLTIGAMGIGFIWASVDPTQSGLAWMWTIMAVLFTLWSVILVIWKKQKPFHMPQWTLFAVVSVLAVLGMIN